MILIKSSLQRPSKLPRVYATYQIALISYACVEMFGANKFKVTCTENVSLQYLHLLACFTAVN